MSTAAYSFLPWLRRGIATAITTAPATGRPEVSVTLRVDGSDASGGGTQTQHVQRAVALYGPGDVNGLSGRAIVRTDPLDWVTNFDPNYLPLIEFYDEDLPWRYSPDVADPGTGRLRPWLALIVLADDEFTDPGPPPPGCLPFVEISDPAVLPPADQLGAWAHVHVNRTVVPPGDGTASDDMAAVLPRLAAVLAENPDLACSRLLCPRRLEPEAGYHAFLVPAFETGRLAGLGLDPADSPGALHSSWADYPNRPQPTRLCHYHHWQFRTAPVGDFEYLVRLIKPRPLGARVGNRDLDVRSPGAGLPGIVDPHLAGVLRLGGALKVPDSALTPEELAEAQRHENWDQPYPHPFQTALAALINLADTYATQTPLQAHRELLATSRSFTARLAGAGDQALPDPDPMVTPPLYGRWHARASRLLTAEDGSPVTPNDNWVHELNLDPRFRVPAGTGARVVRRHQEEYVQASWEQLGDVLRANRRLRAAQVAREVGFAHHDRHLAPARELSAGRFLGLSAPLQSRVPTAGAEPGGPTAPTLAAALADSVVGPAPLSAVMRRITRPGSRLIRDLPFGSQGPQGPNVVRGATAPTARGLRPDDLVTRMNDGEVTAAPPKSAPSGIVTVDALEQAMPGPIGIGSLPTTPRSGDPVPNPVPELPSSSDFVISLPGEGVHPAGGGLDSAEAAAFKQALNDAYDAFDDAYRAGQAPSRTRLDLPAVVGAAMTELHPDRTVPRRALAGVALPDRLRPGRETPPEGPGLAATATSEPDPLAEVMAYPVIDLPMYRPLLEMSPDLFCPNVNQVPPNSLTLMETNPRFIESYLVGLNHELARELLWREYPTDQRGSVFRQFWDVTAILPQQGETAEQRRERLRDITPIDEWDPQSHLGTHSHRDPAGEQLVLIIRAELLKKYPKTVVYAHKAEWRARRPDGSPDPSQGRALAELVGDEVTDPPPDKVRSPLFDAKTEPDVYFFGFGLTEELALGGTGEDPHDDAGWFFVLKERPGDPRFGLDVEQSAQLQVWNDLAWPDLLPAASGPGPAYLRLDGTTPTLSLTEPTDPADAEKAEQYAEDRALTWNAQINAADVAYILFQAPVLVAVHAREMLSDG